MSLPDGHGNTSVATHNGLGLSLTETDPLGNVTKHEYDNKGRLVKSTDARGSETTYAYDLLDRPIAVTDAFMERVSEAKLQGFKFPEVYPHTEDSWAFKKKKS